MDVHTVKTVRAFQHTDVYKSIVSYLKGIVYSEKTSNACTLSCSTIYSFFINSRYIKVNKAKNNAKGETPLALQYYT